MRSIKILIILLFLSFNVSAENLVNEDFINTKGGVYIAEISEKEYKIGLKYGEIDLLTKKYNDKYYLIYGIPYNLSSNIHKIKVTSKKSEKYYKIILKDILFDKQYIEISKRFLKPSSRQIKRIMEEKKLLLEARPIWTNNDPDLKFRKPVDGVITGNFGTERYYNNKKGRHHNGLDIAAPIGTKIVAPSKGTILLAENFFYNGKFVMIDHGKGLLSMYLHMDKILVKKGDRVNKGDNIGLVGNTGKSSGAHLHWSILLNQKYINPLLFLMDKGKLDKAHILLEEK